MKLSFCLFVVGIQMFAQNKNFFSMSLGTIKHSVSTRSLNGKITGKDNFDILPEIKYERLIKGIRLRGFARPPVRKIIRARSISKPQTFY